MPSSLRPLIGSVLLIFLLTLSSGCVTTTAQKTRPGSVHHIVLCWLKKSGDPEARAKLIAVSKTFADIPGVISVNAGTMIPSKRSIVDSTFDVAIVETFPSQEAMNAYLVHPLHKKAVKEVLLPLVKKIVVYDFTEQ